jgi:hypothetical protein
MVFLIILGVLAYLFVAFLTFHVWKSKGIGEDDEGDYSVAGFGAVFWPIGLTLYSMYRLGKHVANYF